LEIDLDLHPRFYSEDLGDSFALAELLSQGCQERLMEICPNYWDRVVHALGKVSEFLDDSEEKLEGDVSINLPPEHHCLKWLLNLLRDLEATPSPHPRFESGEKLTDLLTQANLLSSNCSAELLKICPDYWERCSHAAAELIKLLPSSTVDYSNPEEFSGCVHRLKAAIEYGTAWVKIVLKPWQATQRRAIVQALGTVAQTAVLRLTQILPDWLTWSYQF